jgi:hypothetical protein
MSASQEAPVIVSSMPARRGVVVALAMAFVAPVAAEPFQHSSGEWREYHRDWLASCPDLINEDAPDFTGYSCFASTGSEELNSANLPAFKLTLIRNRLNGELDIAMTVAADDAETDTSRPLLMSFGGEAPEQFSFSTDLETRYNTTNQFFIVDADRRAALLDKLRDRTAVTMTVPLTGARNKAEVRLSLRGVLASLDFMNAYARRVSQY